MKIDLSTDTLLIVKSTAKFNKDLKRIYKQGKDISKLKTIIEKLANEEKLEEKYKNHDLIMRSTIKVVNNAI